MNQRSSRAGRPAGTDADYVDVCKHLTERDDHQTTTPLQTLLDAAASPLSPEHFEAAVRDALSSDLISPHKLAAATATASTEIQERFAQIELT